MSVLAILMSLSTVSFAAADVTTTIAVPSGVDVYVDQTIDVTVSNIGNRNARNVTLTIQLPETSTSPSVFVQGILASYDGRCSEVGTTLECDLGRVRRNRSTTVSFDIAFPWSANPLDVSAVVSTDSSENNYNNNDDLAVATVEYIDQPFTAPRTATNHHCTGTSLSSFYECTLFPSSISMHTIVLEADGSITFLGPVPGYTGIWGTGADDELWYEYFYLGSPTLSFYGRGVGGNCFEGMATSGGPYVSPYEACI